MQSAGTLCSQQEPLMLTGTLDVSRNHAQKKQYIHLNCSRNPSGSAGFSLSSIAKEIFAPELQQEPFVVSWNLSLQSAGTPCNQQEPLMLSGTMHRKSHISTTPIVETLSSRTTYNAIKVYFIFLNCGRNLLMLEGTFLLCLKSAKQPPKLQQKHLVVRRSN